MFPLAVFTQRPGRLQVDAQNRLVSTATPGRSPSVVAQLGGLADLLVRRVSSDMALRLATLGPSPLAMAGSGSARRSAPSSELVAELRGAIRHAQAAVGRAQGALTRARLRADQHPRVIRLTDHLRRLSILRGERSSSARRAVDREINRAVSELNALMARLVGPAERNYEQAMGRLSGLRAQLADLERPRSRR
jgi:hypothetical protein